jgi:ribosomal protein L32E
MKKIKFLRRNTERLLRLGKKRKKLQKWRTPKGRDNKMRLREKGYPATVEIGYKKSAKTRGKIEGKEVLLIGNVSELEKAGKNSVIILRKVGKKNKIEIAKKAKELNVKIKNLDLEKILQQEKSKVVEKNK